MNFQHYGSPHLIHNKINFSSFGKLRMNYAACRYFCDKIRRQKKTKNYSTHYFFASSLQFGSLIIEIKMLILEFPNHKVISIFKHIKSLRIFKHIKNPFFFKENDRNVTSDICYDKVNKLMSYPQIYDL